MACAVQFSGWAVGSGHTDSHIQIYIDRGWDILTDGRTDGRAFRHASNMHTQRQAEVCGQPLARQPSCAGRQAARRRATQGNPRSDIEAIAATAAVLAAGWPYGSKGCRCKSWVMARIATVPIDIAAVSTACIGMDLDELLSIVCAEPKDSRTAGQSASMDGEVVG